MNRVTLFAPDGHKLFAVDYDPEVTLFQEALESAGTPDVVTMVRESYAPDSDAWVGSVGSYRARLTYQGFTAVINGPGTQLELWS